MNRLDDFKTFNRIKRLNNGFQIFFICLLLIGLSLLSPYCRLWLDFSHHKSHTFHNETKVFLKTLTQSVEIYLLFDPHAIDDDFNAAFYRFLHSLKHELPPQVPFYFEAVSTLQQPQKILQLKERYMFEDNTGILIVLGQRSAFFNFNAFLCKKKWLFEHKFFNAFTYLSSKPKVIYWLVGHGELDGRNVHPTQGALEAYKILQQLYYDVRFVSFIHTLPSDADAIFIFGPKRPFFPKENRILQEFLQRGGHILICLHPIYQHGLNAFLNTLGLNCRSELLLDNGPDVINQKNIIMNHFPLHPLTQPLIEKDIGLLFGLTTPLEFQSRQPLTKPCILSAKTSWCKSALHLQSLDFNPRVERLGSRAVCNVFAPEIDTFNLKLWSGKAVIVGCADWMDNAHIPYLGNRLFLQSISRYFNPKTFIPLWNDIISELPYKVTLSQKEFFCLMCAFLILPFICLIMGIIITFVREK